MVEFGATDLGFGFSDEGFAFSEQIARSIQKVFEH